MRGLGGHVGLAEAEGVGRKSVEVDPRRERHVERAVVAGHVSLLDVVRGNRRTADGRRERHAHFAVVVLEVDLVLHQGVQPFRGRCADQLLVGARSPCRTSHTPAPSFVFWLAPTVPSDVGREDRIRAVRQLVGVGRRTEDQRVEVVVRRWPGEVGLRQELRAGRWSRRDVEVEEPPVAGLRTPAPVLRVVDRTVVVELVRVARRRPCCRRTSATR